MKTASLNRSNNLNEKKMHLYSSKNRNEQDLIWKDSYISKDMSANPREDNYLLSLDNSI